MPKYFATPADDETSTALAGGARITGFQLFRLYRTSSEIPEKERRYPFFELHLPKSIAVSSSPMPLVDLNIIFYKIQHEPKDVEADLLNPPGSYDELVSSSSDSTLAPINIARLFHDYHRPLSDEVPGWFSLMLTGHWNRNHLTEARALENSIRECTNLIRVTTILETEYQRLVSTGANLEGSYARRIQFALLTIDNAAPAAPLAAAPAALRTAAH